MIRLAVALASVTVLVAASIAEMLAKAQIWIAAALAWAVAAAAKAVTAAARVVEAAAEVVVAPVVAEAVAESAVEDVAAVWVAEVAAAVFAEAVASPKLLVMMWFWIRLGALLVRSSFHLNPWPHSRMTTQMAELSANSLLSFLLLATPLPHAFANWRQAR